MKASELVAHLQALIAEHGDLATVMRLDDDTGGTGQTPLQSLHIVPYDPYMWTRGEPNHGEPVILLRDY